MKKVSIEYAKKNLSKLIDETNEKYKSVIVVNSKDKNAVLFAEEEWNSISETLYLYSIPGMVESIKESVKEDKSKMKVYNEETIWDEM